MKKRSRALVLVLCLGIFSLLAIGSGSSEETETKDIVVPETLQMYWKMHRNLLMR